MQVYHHKNQKVSSVRLHAAKFSKASPDSIELKIADEVLTPGNDYKLLHRSQVESTPVVHILKGWLRVVKGTANKGYYSIVRSYTTSKTCIMLLSS